MEGQPGDLQGLAATTAKAIEKESAPAAISKDPAPPAGIDAPPATENVAQATEDVPDPDEDDLDDLDDMLDEFIPSKSEIKTATTSGPGRPPTTATAPAPLDFEAFGDGLSDDDFARQLQAGMAELMGGLDTSLDMPAQFENMLKELGGAAALSEAAGLGVPGPSVPSTEKSASTEETAKKSAVASNATEASFQEKIAKTMERMQASSDQASTTKKSAAASSATEESFQETIAKTMERMQASGDQTTDDILAEMMKAMQGEGLDGEGGEEEFSKMLLGMMEQLTNKEILYEPMKELDDKFPAWMEKNTGKVEEADMKRYKEQQIYVREIVQRFETKGYKDENAADREYIVERMQKMQAAGSPPADLVGDMAAAQEAFGAPEEGCPTQ